MDADMTLPLVGERVVHGAERRAVAPVGGPDPPPIERQAGSGEPAAGDDPYPDYVPL